MKDLFVRFMKEEDGMGTVELVVIVAVLLGIALIFRRSIFSFVDKVVGGIFNNDGVKDVVDNPVPSPTPAQ